MLGTKIQEIMSREELEKHLMENEAVIVCAGRLGPMCIPVYKAMEQMEQEKQFSNIKFLTVDFDTDAAIPVITSEKCRGFMGLPFTAYFKDGEVINATSSIQSRTQIEENIRNNY